MLYEVITVLRPHRLVQAHPKGPFINPPQIDPVPGAGGFEKELVVKRILPARAQDQGFIKMLVNEAKLTVQLTHSNIAQIYECVV